MKCPVCIEKGLKSNVYPGCSFSTAMWCAPYYDEDGKYHNHDMNTHSTSYSCSQGHRWTQRNASKCPSCDFESGDNAITIEKSDEMPNGLSIPLVDLTSIDDGVSFSSLTISASDVAIPLNIVLDSRDLISGIIE